MSSRKPKPPKSSGGNTDESDERRRLAEAQLLVDRAFDEDDSERQIALAIAALELSPDCAEAYLILAENEPISEEAISLYEAGVGAARREIGESEFRKCAGHFWEVVETRPYMRARLDLAECLWDAGHISQAIDHFQEMLKLNPNDNLGCRQRLASALLKTGRREELHDLLTKYPDDFLVDLHYTRALLAFQEQGDTEESRAYLHKAEVKNPHVPAFLTGAKPLPREYPEYISPGEESEAACYAGEFLPAWRETPGAVPWVRATLKVARPAPTRRRSAPWSRVKQVLQQLPQSDAVWEVDLVPLAPETRASVWAFLIVDASSAKPLFLDVQDDRPSDSELWQALIAAMRNPQDEEPARPQEIRLARKTWHKNWGSKLTQVGTDCALVEELTQIPDIITDMRNTVRETQRSDEDRPPIDDEQLASIPQQIGDTWLAAVRKLPAWIQIGEEMVRPYVLLVVDETNDLIVATELNEEEPPDDWLWTGLQDAICRPAAGEPHRPGVVQITSDHDAITIGDRLESIGIRCVVAADNKKIDAMLGDLGAQIGGSQVRSLLDSPGVTTEQLAGFFAAADEFYRRAPWRRIPGDTIIRIEVDAFSSNVWYAVVMGQMGMQLGLALYEDLELVRGILTGQMSDKENAARSSALSLTYGEAFDISPLDYDAIQQHKWPIASEEAFPSVMRVNPGLAMRTPLAWEIELLEGCLRALPPFLEEGAASSTQRVRTSTREMAIQLSLVE